MKWDSLKTQLLEKVKNAHYGANEWVSGGELEQYTLALGYKPSNGSRRLRELENSGIIESRYVKGKRGETLVEYRWANELLTKNSTTNLTQSRGRLTSIGLIINAKGAESGKTLF